jgi:hypothetical protein
MITKQNFFIIIILVLFGVIAVQQFTSNRSNEKPTINVNGKNYELLKQKIDTGVVHHSKIKYVKGKDIPYKPIVENNIEVPVYVEVDTEQILKEYHAKIIYNDKLVLDNDLGTIELTDTISMNKIIGRKWNAQIKERTITDTKIVKELSRNQVFIGLGGVLGNSNILVGPQLILKTKKDNIYSVNVYVDNNLNKYIGFNLAWKIKLKK